MESRFLVSKILYLLFCLTRESLILLSFFNERYSISFCVTKEYSRESSILAIFVFKIPAMRFSKIGNICRVDQSDIKLFVKEEINKIVGIVSSKFKSNNNVSLGMDFTLSIKERKSSRLFLNIKLEKMIFLLSEISEEKSNRNRNKINKKYKERSVWYFI